MATMFDAGREMTSPRNSGKAFGEFGIETLRNMPLTLTPEEEASPCAKYYYLLEVELSEEHKKVLAGGPMNPEDCYMPEEVGERMLNTGYERIENGYGVLPNGVGFAAMNIKQTGRTDEKVKFYREEMMRRIYLHMKHCIVEYTNETRLMNLFWEEHHK